MMILSDEYFSRMRILYDDTEALLQRDLEAAQRLCDLFNAEIAPAFICASDLLIFVAPAQFDPDPLVSCLR